MKTVNVDKARLREIVARNRDTHRAQFEESLDGWHRAAIAELDRLLTDAKANRINRVYVNLPRPEDHTLDYDRVLEMLDMSVDDVVELSEQEFAHFVQDNWGWKNQWLISNSGYSTSVSASATASGLVIPDNSRI